MYWVQIEFPLFYMCRKDYLFGSILSVCGTSQKLTVMNSWTEQSWTYCNTRARSKGTWNLCHNDVEIQTKTIQWYH